MPVAPVWRIWGRVIASSGPNHRHVCSKPKTPRMGPAPVLGSSAGRDLRIATERLGPVAGGNVARSIQPEQRNGRENLAQVAAHRRLGTILVPLGDGVQDSAMLLDQVRHMAFERQAQPAHPVQVDLAAVNEPPDVRPAGDGAEALVQLLVQEMELLGILLARGRFLALQERAQAGERPPVGAARDPADDAAFQALADELRLLQLGEADAGYEAARLWIDRDQPVLGQT